jgi:hypothetical protein
MWAWVWSGKKSCWSEDVGEHTVMWQISSGAGPAGLGWPTLERYGVLLEPVERAKSNSEPLLQNRKPLLVNQNQNDESVHERAEVVRPLRAPGSFSGTRLTSTRSSSSSSTSSTSDGIGSPRSNTDHPSYLLLTQVQRFGLDPSPSQEVRT